MKFLIIMLCMTALNNFLSFCPITISASFDKELSVNVRYLFIRYKIMPRAAKKKKKKAKKEKPKSSKIKNLYEKKGLPGFLNFITGLARIASGTAKKIFQHLLIGKFSINISVASDDAAQTALNYGYVCSVVYPAVSEIMSNAKYKDYSVNVKPDFNSKKSHVRFNIKASIKVFFLISAVIYALMNFIKFSKRQNNANLQQNTD